jgi:hypothetical protein
MPLVSSSGHRDGAPHEWPAAPAPRVQEFEARLSQREAVVRAGLADLELQLSALQALVTSGCEGPAEEAMLADAFASLRRELDCVVSARRAVASLRTDVSRSSLAAHRAASGSEAPDASPRRAPAGKGP